MFYDADSLTRVCFFHDLFGDNIGPPPRLSRNPKCISLYFGGSTVGPGHASCSLGVAKPHLLSFFDCSACSGEGQGQQSAAKQLFLRQQPVHEPQGERGVGLWRRVRLQLRIGARGASDQEEAACGAQLDSPTDSSPPLPLVVVCFLLPTSLKLLLAVCTQPCLLTSASQEARWRLCERDAIYCV